MFQSSLKSISKQFKNGSIAYCQDILEEKPALIQAADEADERLKQTKTPPSFDYLRKQIVSQGGISTYDGFRMAVQKQVNLNTVVSHFYWVGSSQMPQPLYQYRFILTEDENLLNVATDMDFNIEGEVKAGITPNISTKLNFVISENSKYVDMEVNVNGKDSSVQAKVSNHESMRVGLSYMQYVLPSLSVGGSFQIDLASSLVNTAYGAVFDSAENLVAVVYDEKLQVVYLRRVNPNRVNLVTDLVLGNGVTTMSVAAQYFLKQSKLEIGVDSNVLIRSMLETTVFPGLSIALSAEMMQAKDHYKFGTGVTLGG